MLDVGGSLTLDHSVNAVAVDGHIALIGILGGFKAQLMLPKLFGKQVHLTGFAVGSAAMQLDMLKALEAGKIKPVIDKSFSFEQLADAFRYLEQNQHFGKIIVQGW